MASPLTVVIVSYNVAGLLERCVRSVYASAAAAGVAPHVIVVDNSSTDNSVQIVRDGFPDAQLIANTKNVGFGAACNQGLEEAGDSALFLNPDTELDLPAVEALLRRLEATPRAALVGPALRFPDGQPQPSRRRFPSLTALAFESTPVDWRLSWLPPLRRYRYGAAPESAERVDWLSGACLLARTAALREVGGFDPRFFMYFEEVDLCRRLAAQGWETWYEPSTTVIHHHSQSADQDVSARNRHYFHSKRLYADRYLGRSTARLIMAVGGLSFLIEALAQRLRGDTRVASRHLRLARLHLTGA